MSVSERARKILKQAAADIRTEALCRFNMVTYGSLLGDGSEPTPCRTAGCIAGTIVARQAPEEWRRYLRGDPEAASPDVVARDLLGFDNGHANHMFMGYWLDVARLPLESISKAAAAKACEMIADGRLAHEGDRWVKAKKERSAP